jgi:hypothetical protein
VSTTWSPAAATSRQKLWKENPAEKVIVTKLDLQNKLYGPVQDNSKYVDGQNNKVDEKILQNFQVYCMQSTVPIST